MRMPGVFCLLMTHWSADFEQDHAAAIEVLEASDPAGLAECRAW